MILHQIFSVIDRVRLAGIRRRILATPENHPIALGFFVNAEERGVHPALFPDAAFIRVNFPRPRHGWNGDRFAQLLKLLSTLTANRAVEAIVWGYRDIRSYGIDIGSYFDRCWRVERALIEPPAAAGNAFVVGYRSIYFDGRNGTDLESRLNALTPGELPQSSEGKRLLTHILDAALSKFSGKPAPVRLTERDLLIIGQCTGDQALEYTDTLTRDNPGLVGLVAKHLLAGDRRFERVYYKPHPKNPTTLADLAHIRENYPHIQIIDGSVGIVQLLEGKPTVATLTSGVGLEAAVRGCEVHTFGISFYSHWGFTIDHMSCPRRTNRLSPEDVLLFTVMHHTRYSDPHKKRPISALAAFGLSLVE
jgi:capsular polysaccharide export protein